MGKIKDLIVVSVSAIALGISSRIVTNGIDKLWETQGFFFKAADLLATPFSGNKDIPVLLTIGILTGWFCLFLVDGTKRFQAGVVAFVGSISVGVRLRETGRIVEAISRSPEAFVIGISIGLITGLITGELYGVKKGRSMSIFQKLSWIQFSQAVGAFRSSIAIIIALSMVEYARISSPSPSAIFFTASVILLLSLSVFMKYEYQKNVITISPPDEDNEYKYHPYVMGGLFDRANKEFHGFSIKGGSDLQQASRARAFETLKDRFTNEVAFGFVSGIDTNAGNRLQSFGSKILPRTVKLTSNGKTTSDIANINSNTNPNRYVLIAKLFISTINRHFITLIPSPVRGLLPNKGIEELGKLDRADTIILIGPTLSENDLPPKGANKFDAICARYKNDPTTEVLLATIEAKEDSIRDEQLRINCMDNLGISQNNLSWLDVYTLPWFGENNKNNNDKYDQDDEYMKLLDRLVN